MEEKIDDTWDTWTDIYIFTVADNPVSNDNLDGDVFTTVEGIFILSIIKILVSAGVTRKCVRRKLRSDR